MPNPQTAEFLQNLRFFGGKERDFNSIRKALAASVFPWHMITGPVDVNIGDYPQTTANPGKININQRLLRSGIFAWPVIQHEFAHLFDYSRLNDQMRSEMAKRLLATQWWSDGKTRHHDAGFERFAEGVAWGYWPSKLNYAQKARGFRTRKDFRVFVDAYLARLQNPSSIQTLKSP